MNRFIAMLGLVTPLSLAGCGTGLESLLYDTYWDSTCACYLPLYLQAAPPLLAEDFADGAPEDRWESSGSVTVDGFDGEPAPAIGFGAAGGVLTTREVLPLVPGLEIDLAARFRALAGQPGSASIELEDAATGAIVASVEVDFAADGSAAITYAIVDPAGHAVEATEWAPSGVAGAAFRTIRLSVMPGATTWSVDGETKVASADVFPESSVRLTLAASSADARFDSVRAGISP